MSQEHKDALAKGRKESREIKAYLSTIESKKRGRPVTKESLETRLARVNSTLDSTADPLKRVDLLQSRLDLESALANTTASVDVEQLEAGFVASAAGYSERKGITYTAWREFGVPAAVLKRAGVPETRRR
jgi:hypothetical protein